MTSNSSATATTTPATATTTVKTVSANSNDNNNNNDDASDSKVNAEDSNSTSYSSPRTVSASPSPQNSEEPTDYAEDENNRRRIGRWFLGATLGKGGYSWVKKGIDRKNGRMVALKFMDRRLDTENKWKQSQIRQVRTEIEALRQIRHQNIMRLLAYNLHAKYPDRSGNVRDVILLVLEFSSGGELFDILYYTSKLAPIMARTYFQQLILAIEACHKAGIVHRDIKPQNMLLDKNYNLKLTDFGLAKIYANASEMEDHAMDQFHVGTRGYQAPEILKREPYYKESDMFAMGVVLFILLTGYPPFEHARAEDKWYKHIVNKDYKRFWKSHRGCGLKSHATDLISRLIHYNPKKRITFLQMRKHPWVCSEILSGSDLINIMRMKHQKMEAKRKLDPVKLSILEGSVKKPVIPVFESRLAAANLKADALPPALDEFDCVSCYNDFYTDLSAFEALQEISIAVVEQMEGELISADENTWEVNEMEMIAATASSEPKVKKTPSEIIADIDIYNFSLAFKVAIQDLDDPSFQSDVVRIHVRLVRDVQKDMNLIKCRHIRVSVAGNPAATANASEEATPAAAAVHQDMKAFRSVLDRLTKIAVRSFSGLAAGAVDIAELSDDSESTNSAENIRLLKLYKECFPEINTAENENQT